MRKFLLIGLFLGYFLQFLAASAQPGLPPDFEHPVDTIYITSTPQGGGKQVIDTLQSLANLKIQVSYIPYNIVITTPNAETFSRYLRTLVVEPGVLAQAGTVGPTIGLKMSGCLVMVPKGAPGVNSRPILQDGLGGRARMFEYGNWYYCYVQYTKEGQRFTCNPTNEYNKDKPFWPAQNAVIIMGPEREVTINAIMK